MAHDRWEPKYVGMQVVAEGLAIAAFRFMQRETKDELLKELLEYIMKDEAPRRLPGCWRCATP